LFPEEGVLRRPQIIKDFLEQLSVVDVRREQPLDVLHHEYRRPVVSDDLEVFDIEVLPVIVVSFVVLVSVVSRTPRDR